jgi:hypothetical protein
MRRTFFAALVTAIFAVAVPTALATSPHFVTGPTASTTVSGNTITLLVSFKGAGLGNAATTATWDVSGTGQLFSRCYTKSGNKPQADNKQETVPINSTFSTPVTNGQTTVTNGVVATITSTLTCPGGQHVVIESFSATGTLSLEGSALSADLSWSFPS